MQKDQKCDFTMITGDINFSNTDWKTMHSEDNYQSTLLGLLLENNFEQIMESDNKIKLDVLLNSCFSNEIQKPTIHYALDKINWKEMIQKLKAEPFNPYCYSNVDKIVEQWYDWLNSLWKHIFLV